MTQQQAERLLELQKKGFKVIFNSGRYVDNNYHIHTAAGGKLVWSSSVYEGVSLLETGLHEVTVLKEIDWLNDKILMDNGF